MQHFCKTISYSASFSNCMMKIMSCCLGLCCRLIHAARPDTWDCASQDSCTGLAVTGFRFREQDEVQQLKPEEASKPINTDLDKLMVVDRDTRDDQLTAQVRKCEH